MTATTETWTDFIRGEHAPAPVYPCCICGHDSHAWASFVESGEWLCRACDEADARADHEGREIIAIEVSR